MLWVRVDLLRLNDLGHDLELLVSLIRVRLARCGRLQLLDAEVLEHLLGVIN